MRKRHRHSWEIQGAAFTPPVGGKLRLTYYDDDLARELLRGVTVIVQRCVDCYWIQTTREIGDVRNALPPRERKVVPVAADLLPLLVITRGVQYPAIKLTLRDAPLVLQIDGGRPVHLTAGMSFEIPTERNVSVSKA